MALAGYVAVAGTALAGFIAFLIGKEDLAFWPMLGLVGLVIVYSLGLTLYQRRT